MPEVGEVFQEVFFVEAKPPEANEIAAAQADAVKSFILSKLPATVTGSCSGHTQAGAATRLCIAHLQHTTKLFSGTSPSKQAANKQQTKQQVKQQSSDAPLHPAVSEMPNAIAAYTAIKPLPMLQVRAASGVDRVLYFLPRALSSAHRLQLPMEYCQLSHLQASAGLTM